MNDPTERKSEEDRTPKERFLQLAKRIVAVPKKDVDALQAAWKKTKHKRGPTPSTSSPDSA